MRLRNRMNKATAWTDGDLLRWPRDKREFYRSLWACAEDSACIIDDMFELKLTAWASPVDADLTVEQFEEWRDELIAVGKLVPYETGGRRYLYIPTMAEHEKPRNPQTPDWPLPPWVTCTVVGEGRGRRVEYVHGDYRVSVQSPSGNRNTSPALPCPALPCTALGGSVVKGTPTPTFDDCYEAYPVHRFEDEARAEYDTLVASGTDPADILASCKAAPRSTRQPLGKYLSERTWRDHLPKPTHAPCTNPACVNGHVPTDGEEWARCPECNGGAT